MLISWVWSAGIVSREQTHPREAARCSFKFWRKLQNKWEYRKTNGNQFQICTKWSLVQKFLVHCRRPGCVVNPLCCLKQHEVWSLKAGGEVSCQWRSIITIITITCPGRRIKTNQVVQSVSTDAVSGFSGLWTFGKNEKTFNLMTGIHLVFQVYLREKRLFFLLSAWL